MTVTEKGDLERVSDSNTGTDGSAGASTGIVRATRNRRGGSLMHARCWVTPLALLLAAPVMAQQEAELHAFGSDRFLAGRSANFKEVGVDDLFMAGETVRAESNISGSAHMVGRRVEMLGAAGGDVYLAGMSLVLTGSVAGDATLAGYDARVGAVGGDLRIAGNTLVVEGPVAGYATIAGDDVRIEGPILGDVFLNGGSLSFSDRARIDGKLILFEEELGEHPIPASVVREDQIERRDIEEWEGAITESERSGWGHVATKVLLQIAALVVFATLAAGTAPQRVAELRQAVLAQPCRILLRGFLVEAAIVGSGILLAMTLIGFAMTLMGILALPASVLVALVVGIPGYVVAVYSLGVGLLVAFGRPQPDGLRTRALAAGLGALVARSIALVPYLGWLAFLALTLTGVGALTIKWFQPKAVLASGA